MANSIAVRQSREKMHNAYVHLLDVQHPCPGAVFGASHSVPSNKKAGAAEMSSSILVRSTSPVQ